MKERPILFSGPMVKAILEGRKTQTRRLVKPGAGQSKWLTPVTIEAVKRWAPSIDDFWTMAVGEERRVVHCGQEMDGGHIGSVRCPFGSAGDRLWVREAFAPRYFDDNRPGYRADWTAKRLGDVVTPPRWTPAIHMPRAACRLVLDLSSVRVERLQDITTADIIAEGVKVPDVDYAVAEDPRVLDAERDDFARGAFRALWDSINGKGAPWASDPWTWALTFARVPS